jgi:uncharacterized protein (TIRG00374 family)
VVVVLIFFYFLPRIVDYDEVWAAITNMTWFEVTTLAVFAVWNQATYVFVEIAARPGLRFSQGVKITQTSTVVSNTLPAGAALGAGLQTAMYVSYGYKPADVAISMALTGLWNTFVKLAMPIVALAALAFTGNSSDGLAAAAIIGLAVLMLALAILIVALRSEAGATTLGRRLGPLLDRVLGWFRQTPGADWAATFGSFRRRTVSLLGRRWLPLTAATLVSHITLYLVLLLTLRHVGISNAEVGWEEALAAFAFIRLLSALPITPGGLGVVELGLTAALTAAGGNEAEVVAAVLVYRALTFVLPIPMGALAYFMWRGERRTAAPPA